METLLTERQLAEKTGISVRTLQTWRSEGAEHAPPYHKIGASVRYRLSEVEACLDECEVRSTTEADVDGGEAA
jgi:predicted DNA-binding transcriptional regulator AlpA